MKQIWEWVWPIGLIVISNILYHVAAKQSPEQMNPMASLTVTYLVGAFVSAILYFVTNRGGDFISEFKHLNFAPFLLGLVIVGLEAGYIYAYRIGWTVGTASITQSAILAVALIFVGYFAYAEKITWNVVLGAVICLVGLFFINGKFGK